MGLYCKVLSFRFAPYLSWQFVTPTESRGKGLQGEVTRALSIQRIKHVLQLLCRQRQLSVEPLQGKHEHTGRSNAVTELIWAAMQNMAHRFKITKIIVETLLLKLWSLKCALSGLSFSSLHKAFLLGNTHHKQQQAKGRMLARALVNWPHISDSACLRVPFPRAFSL